MITILGSYVRSSILTDVFPQDKNISATKIILKLYINLIFIQIPWFKPSGNDALGRHQNSYHIYFSGHGTPCPYILLRREAL